MSLTSQIHDRSSPVSQWFAHAIQHKPASAIVSEVNNRLAGCPIMRVVGHKDYSVVGAAFDYLFRWQFGDLKKTVAMNGALVLAMQDGWTLAPNIVHSIIQTGNRSHDEPRRQAICAMFLAWFETCFRSPRRPYELKWAMPCQTVQEAIHCLHQQIKVPVINDILALHETIPHVWGDDLQRPFILNPTFAGSVDIGGADADWVMDDVLFDCKVSIQQRPFSRGALLQGLGYVLLDYDDRYGIRQVGWYFARQQMRIVYPVDDLLQHLGVSSTVSELREQFRGVLENTANG